MTDTPLTPTVIAAAEQVAGIEYTEAERELMLESLAAQIARAKARRAYAMPNDWHPALRFDPRLPGFVPRQPDSFDPMLPQIAPLPNDDADIAFASVGTLAGWIRCGAITSAFLTTLYLDRIARIGPRLECIALATPEIALAQARAADAAMEAGTWLGPLHGIPYGCKDILDTDGLPTRWGADTHVDRVAAGDAAVVRRLAAAGAVLVAKTAVGALAYGDIWHGGVSRNPWNTEEGSSGSSAGSGSGTAAGLFGFSIGTETLGSIVSPSARCGVTGLRPTFGRVSRQGAMALCWSLDKIGPMCRSVADTALVLSAIAGYDPADLGSIDLPFGFDPSRGIAGMRVGYFPVDMESAPDQAILAAVRGLGVDLVPLERADLPYGSLVDLLYAEAAAAFEDLTLSDRDDLLKWQDAVAWPNAFRRARFLSAVDHVQLDRLRRRTMLEADRWFAEGGVDAIVGSATVGPMTSITNFTAQPCLVMRAGFTHLPSRIGRGIGNAPGFAGSDLHRVPYAACIWGRLFDEDSVLRLGLALEEALGVVGERPEG